MQISVPFYVNLTITLYSFFESKYKNTPPSIAASALHK